MKSPWWIGLGLMSLVAFCTVAVAADKDCKKKDKDAVSLVADDCCEKDGDCEKEDELLADEECEKDGDCEKEDELLADKCKKGDKEGSLVA